MLRVWSYPSPAAALAHFGRQLEVGYDQLYFLIVIMEFYLVFPLVLMLLRRTRGHHGLVLAVAVVAQFAMSIGMHWKLLPTVLIEYGQENALCYVLYLVGGAVVAYHLSDVHDWVCRHAALVVFLTLAATAFAEGVYFLAQTGVTRALGWGSDPFQPSVIPFNVGALACVYLAGMFLVQPWRSRRTRAAVRIGSDNAYGIYLAQMLFISTLTTLGWVRFAERAPFWVWIPLTLAIAYFGSIALTAVLARTPLAVPLTGRKQEPWRTLLPRRVPAPGRGAGHGRTQGRRSRDSPGAGRAGGHRDRSERNVTVLTEQIDAAAACRGDAAVPRGRGRRRGADLRRAEALGAGLGPAPGRGRDTCPAPGWRSGCRTRSATPAPWPASWRRAGWRSRSIPALPRPRWRGC